MNSLETKTTQKKPKANRFALSVEAFGRVNHWMDQIKGQRQSLKIKPGDVIEFVLMNRGLEFDSNEIQAYMNKNISEVDLAKWLVKELKSAEKRGQKLSLADLIGPVPNTTASPSYNAMSQSGLLNELSTEKPEKNMIKRAEKTATTEHQFAFQSGGK